MSNTAFCLSIQCWTAVLVVCTFVDCTLQRSMYKYLNTCFQLWGYICRSGVDRYFGRLMQRPDSLEKTLVLGKIEGRRGKGWQGMRWLEGITDLIYMSLSKLQGSWWQTGKPGVLQSMGSQRVGHDWTTELSIYWAPSVGQTLILGTPHLFH